MTTVMKSLAAGAAFIMAVEATADEPTPHEFCSTMSDFAEEMMTSRQENLPMKTVMGIVEGHPHLEVIVRRAYRMPLMRHEDNKQRVITEFASDEYGICYSSFD